MLQGGSSFLFQDDSVVMLRSVSAKLKDMQEERDRVEERFNHLQRSLGEVEEGRL